MDATEASAGPAATSTSQEKKSSVAVESPRTKGGGSSDAVDDSRGGSGTAAPAINGRGKNTAAGTGASTSASVGGSSAAGSLGATAAGSGGASAAAASGSPSTAAGTATPAAGSSAQPAVACNPADKSPEPKPVSFKFLGGYQSLSMPPTTGPSVPVIEVHDGFPEWTVYRSETLATEGLHEIMIWAEGGCLQNSTIQGQALLEFASWGFVVLADGFPQDNNSGADPGAGGLRGTAEAAPMISAMDWITAENERPCSMFYHKLDVAKIATGGQSCGGMMTLLSAGDQRVTTAMVFNSGLLAIDPLLFATYHAPMLFLAGGSSDFLSATATMNVNAIDKVPIFYGNLQVGHGGTWESENGGEMGRVALGWLKWKLQGNTQLENMFVGADCELCKPPSEWTVVKKMMD
ncbi:MAG TPA: hypothetical protein VFN67_28455 [Polyangiales bacterium]|nr:hypothetical protein [Polyangiales bacterium]